MKSIRQIRSRRYTKRKTVARRSKRSKRRTRKTRRKRKSIASGGGRLTIKRIPYQEYYNTSSLSR